MVLSITNRMNKSGMPGEQHILTVRESAFSDFQIWMYCKGFVLFVKKSMRK